MTSEKEKKFRDEAKEKGLELKIVTLKEKIFSVPQTFAMPRNNFFLPLLDEVARLTVPFGIPQHLKNYFVYLTDKHKNNIDYTPKVLTVC